MILNNKFAHVKWTPEAFKAVGFYSEYLRCLDECRASVEASNLANFLHTRHQLLIAENKITRELLLIQKAKRERVKRQMKAKKNNFGKKKDAIGVSLFLEVVIASMLDMLKQYEAQARRYHP